MERFQNGDKVMVRNEFLAKYGEQIRGREMQVIVHLPDASVHVLLPTGLTIGNMAHLTFVADELKLARQRVVDQQSKAFTRISEVQGSGGVCAFIDGTHDLDTTELRVLGVRVEELLISQPDTEQHGFEISETLARSGSVDLIVHRVNARMLLVTEATVERR